MGQWVLLGSPRKRRISSKLMPRQGDHVVVVQHLEAHDDKKKYNGVVGTVESFDMQRGCYVVKLVPTPTKQRRGFLWHNKNHSPEEQQRAFAVRNVAVWRPESPTSSTTQDSPSQQQQQQPPPIHIFLPGHVDAERVLSRFLRTAESVSKQVLRQYTVFVGLSGPAPFRLCVTQLVAFWAFHSRSGVRWYLQDDHGSHDDDDEDEDDGDADDTKESPKQFQRCAMEHIYHLLQDSQRVCPQALVMFVENGDMCHPQRFYQFKKLYQASQDKMSSNLCPLSLPCKLMLRSDKLSVEDGLYDNFFHSRNPMDFGQWKINLTSWWHKVKIVHTSQVEEEEEAQTYSDYIVPTSQLVSFFRGTPAPAQRHVACPLRLLAYLDDWTELEPIDCAQIPWLVAHYQQKGVDEDSNRHSKHYIKRDWETMDAPRDVALAKEFHLTAPKVRTYRQQCESLLIQHYNYNESTLRECQMEKMTEINAMHGKGLGEALWKQCQRDVDTLFGVSSRRCWWRWWLLLVFVGLLVAIVVLGVSIFWNVAFLNESSKLGNLGDRIAKGWGLEF